jgi:predicted glycosyltransferase
MRVWIDMTASAHPLVYRPLIEIMRARGDEVEITARDYAQTLQLMELHGLAPDAVIGHHAGRSRTGKARAMWSRLRALRRWASGRGFDVALAHGSHELTMTARRLGIPSATTFDYEWAWLQHQLGCRAATRVVVPDAIPPERLARYGAVPPKLVQYEGLKEEYYLADFEADAAVLGELGVEAAAPLAVVRTPPAVSLYHRFENPLFAEVLRRLRDQAQVVVLPRTGDQRAELARAGGFLVPDRAVDAQSLVAFADLVVSAGGTMNREAVALGTPVYTMFEGRLGAVDERLIAEGRLRRLTEAEDVVVAPRGDAPPVQRVRRDPRVLTGLVERALPPQRT